MSEDAPVNAGAAMWLDLGSARVVVRRMQTKLHRWAGAEGSRRFGDLFNLVYDPAFLLVAWDRVAHNTGARSAGVDGVTVAQIERDTGVRAFLEQIRQMLMSGGFEPEPVRQVEIPKGPGKVRTLGVSTVADRVVQASLKLVLEPIFEADFSPCSYGFRPNRRAHDAIAEIHQFTTHGYHVEPWLAQAAAQWRLQATAGFQGAVDAGLDRLTGSDPNRVGVLAELASRVEHDLQETTVITGAELAGAGVGGPGTEWSRDIIAAEMLPVAAAMRDLFAGRIAWDASTSPML